MLVIQRVRIPEHANESPRLRLMTKGQKVALVNHLNQSQRFHVSPSEQVFAKTRRGRLAYLIYGNIPRDYIAQFLHTEGQGYHLDLTQSYDTLVQKYQGRLIRLLDKIDII